MIYHCGPVVKKEGESYSFVAAGPTTSIREEPYQGTVIEEVRRARRDRQGRHGAARPWPPARSSARSTSRAVGGLATILAKSVKTVRTVFKLEEFGVPEAMWVIDVVKFPAVVTMDSHGKSIHDDVLAASRKEYERLLG